MATRYPSLAQRKQAFRRGEARDAEVRREVAAWPGGQVPPAPAPDIAYAPGLLSTVPGFVHGLIQVDPVFVVQCDACGRVAVGETDPRGERTTLVILFCGIIFAHTAQDRRRMCARCRVEAGWQDHDTRECAADPRKLAFHEAYMVERDTPLF